MEKIKKKTRIIKKDEIFEKKQEEIKYRKAKLLLVAGAEAIPCQNKQICPQRPKLQQ